MTNELTYIEQPVLLTKELFSVSVAMALLSGLLSKDNLWLLLGRLVHKRSPLMLRWDRCGPNFFRDGEGMLKYSKRVTCMNNHQAEKSLNVGCGSLVSEQ